MKLKFKLTLALLASVALIYTACKKSGSSPSSQTVTPKAVASQVALNLATTLNGAFGGFDASAGLQAPEKFVQNRFKGRRMDDLSSDDLCGLVIDTTFNSAVVTEGDNSAKVSGSLKYSLGCTNGIFSSVTSVVNLTIAETTAQLTGTFKITENVTLATINPADDNSNYTLKGSLGYSGDFSYLAGSKESGTAAFTYNPISLVYDSATGEIASGTATFSTTATGSAGAWNCQGTIVFLGNGKATITISGTAYNVDLTTGTVS